MVQESNALSSVMNGLSETGSSLLQQSRSTNVLWKRKEQLLRWEESETNKETAKMKKDASKRKVKFPEGCVFLAACASGDEEEVESLIEGGADVNTANVDGLTALHQAVIDKNLDMVEFLLDQGVDVNAQDNEGWAAIHAAVSCGFEDIVRCLLDHGACLDVVNNDGELPIDLVESEELLALLKQEIHKQNIDLMRAKMQEEEMMTKDAMEWLQCRMIKEKRHPKTGATALHVAASKGYLRVMNILLQAGADVNAKDKDGWTPMHAAAHWGEREACRVLAENQASFDIKNVANQTCFDVADDEVRPYLQDLKEVSKGRRPMEDITAFNTPMHLQRRKNSVTRVSTEDKHEKMKKDERKEVLLFKTASSSEAEDEEEEEGSSDERKRPAEKAPIVSQEKIPRVSREIGQGEPQADGSKPTTTEESGRVPPQGNRPAPKIPKLDVIENRTLTSQKIESPVIKRAKEVAATSSGSESSSQQVPGVNGLMVNKGGSAVTLSQSVSDSSIANRVGKLQNNGKEFPTKAPSYQPKPFNAVVSPSSAAEPQPPSWRITGKKAQAPAGTPPQSPTVRTAGPLQRSGTQPVAVCSPPEVHPSVKCSPKTNNASEAALVQAEQEQQFSTPGKLGSFNPPVRKESAETERKAHSKKQRETRRSTQGITLEQIQSAHQIYSFQGKEGQEKEAEKKEKGIKEPAEAKTTISVIKAPEKDKGQNSTVSKTPSTPTSPNLPPWRSRALENAGQNKQELTTSEGDGVLKPVQPTAEPMSPPIVRVCSGFVSGLSRARPATVISHVDNSGESAKASVVESTRLVKPSEESPVKEESIKASLTPSATALRRRNRHNRRSTGPVAQEDVENLEKEGGEDAGEAAVPSSSGVGSSRIVSGAIPAVSLTFTGTNGESKSSVPPKFVTGRPSSLSGYGNKYPSSGLTGGSERSSSRASSVASLQSTSSVEPDIDYKKLYEKEREENEKLRKRIKELEKQLESQSTSKVTPSGRDLNDVSLSDREKRAFERKISELEEEVKAVEGLRADNQRLKDENGALIRVISKLSK